jgi:TonB family protein
MKFNTTSTNPMNPERGSLLPADNFGRRIGIALAVSLGVNFLLLYGASVMASDMTITPPKRAAEIVINNHPKTTPTPEATPTPTPEPKTIPEPTPTPALRKQPTPKPVIRTTPTPEPVPTPTPEPDPVQPTPTPTPEPQPSVEHIVRPTTTERVTEKTPTPVERDTNPVRDTNPTTPAGRTAATDTTRPLASMDPASVVNPGGAQRNASRNTMNDPSTNLSRAATGGRTIRDNAENSSNAARAANTATRTDGVTSAAATTNPNRTAASMPGGTTAAFDTTASAVNASNNPSGARQTASVFGAPGLTAGRNKVIAMTKETAEVTRTDFTTPSGGAVRSATVVAAQGNSSTSGHTAKFAGGVATSSTTAALTVGGTDGPSGRRPGLAGTERNIALNTQPGGNRPGGNIKTDGTDGAAGQTNVAVERGRPGGTSIGGQTGPGRTANGTSGNAAATFGGAETVTTGRDGNGNARGTAETDGPKTNLPGSGRNTSNGIRNGSENDGARGGQEGQGGQERGNGVNTGPAGQNGQRQTGNGGNSEAQATEGVKDAGNGGKTPGGSDRQVAGVETPTTGGSSEKIESSTPAELRSGPTPTIPANLRDQSLKGTVRAQFTVMSNGRCSVELTSGTGNAQVDAVILSTLRKWTWKAATKNGKPVEATVNQTISVEVR